MSHTKEYYGRGRECVPTVEAFQHMAAAIRAAVIETGKTAKAREVLTSQITSLEEVAAYAAVMAYKEQA
jgi:hypothetical protein